jgi:hypothetical protein
MRQYLSILRTKKVVSPNHNCISLISRVRGQKGLVTGWMLKEPQRNIQVYSREKECLKFYQTLKDLSPKQK